jgi:hypothetical protein
MVMTALEMPVEVPDLDTSCTVCLGARDLCTRCESPMSLCECGGESDPERCGACGGTGEEDW